MPLHKQNEIDQIDKTQNYNQIWQTEYDVQSFPSKCS
jgi:hypothetical protein